MRSLKRRALRGARTHVDATHEQTRIRVLAAWHDKVWSCRRNLDEYEKLLLIVDLPSSDGQWWINEGGQSLVEPSGLKVRTFITVYPDGLEGAWSRFSHSNDNDSSASIRNCNYVLS